MFTTPPMHYNAFQHVGIGESRLLFKASGSSKSRAAARGAARSAASSSKSSSSSSASKAAAAKQSAAAAASRSQQVAAQRQAAAKAAAATAAKQAQARAAARQQAAAAQAAAQARARVEARRTARVQKQAAPSWISMPNVKKPTTTTAAAPAVDNNRLRALGVDDAISQRTLEMLNAADPQMAAKIERLLPLVGNFDLLSEEERGSFFSQINSIANDNVDEPWDDKLNRARSVMQNTIGAAETAFNRMQEGEKLKLKQAVEGLDQDVSTELQTGIDQLNRRGALQGGLFQRLANELLDAREKEAQRLQNISDLNIKSAQTQRDLATKEAQFTLEDLTGEIDNNRKAARETEFNELLGNLVSLDVLKQKASMEALDDAESGDPRSTVAPTTQPTKRTAAQIRSTPVDTSGLSRARPVTPKVTAPKLTSKNSTSQQRVDARRSARLSRLQASSLM